MSCLPAVARFALGAILYSGGIATEVHGVSPREETLVPLEGLERMSGVYPVMARVTATNWTVCVPYSARFGFSVAFAGDVDGDGWGDLMAGAPELDFEGFSDANHGAAFLFRGSSNGPSAAVSWAFFGERASVQMGHSLTGLGDVNGDGYADVALGAPRYDNPGVDSGACYVVLGGRSLALPAPIQFWEGGTRRIWFGWAVGRAGDINRDGLDDLLVGAPLESLTGRRMGAGLLYLGTRGTAGQPLSWRPHWGMRGDASLGQFGRSIAGAGDVDGDGFPDVIVGAPMHDKTLRQAGRALLFRGSANGPSPVPNWAADGTGDNVWFGMVVGGVDFNKDGFSDVFVSAPGQNRSFSTWEGMVNLYTGSSTGLSRVAWISLQGEQAGSRFGSAVDAGGDVNGDGWPDLLVGAPAFDAGVSDSGRVFLFLGTTNGFRSEADWVLNGGELGAKCGLSVAWVGDQNGDGLSDFLVGSPDYARSGLNGGRIDLFYGSRTAYEAVSASEASLAGAPAERGTNATIGVTAAGSPGVDYSTRGRRESLALLVMVVVAAAGFGYWRLRRNSGQHQEAAGAVEAERQRLARDLHDDLGARLTRISLLTELVRREAGSTDAGRQHARLLAETAREVLGTMEQVIWSVNPANDTLENLVNFILQYAGPFLAPAGITLHTDAPTLLPDRTLQSDLRKNVFLCVKESLNNVVKHSHATEVHLRIHYQDSALEIDVEDNGRGAAAALSGSLAVGSDGLNNLRERMRAVGGQAVIENGHQGGLRVRLSVRV